MRMDRFTTLAQEALAAAQAMAVSRSHAEMSPLHVLAAMLEDGAGIASSILNKAGLNAERIEQIAQAELNRKPTQSGGQPHTSPAVMQVLTSAEKEAKSLNDTYISTEHLLLALADVKSDAKEVLSMAGADRKLHVKLELPSGPVEMKVTTVRYESLEDDSGYLIGARILEMSDTDRVSFEKYIAKATTQQPIS